MFRDFMLTLAGGLAAGFVAIALEIWRGFRSRPHLRLDPRVISKGRDMTDALFIGRVGHQEGDTLEVRLVNPTPRTIVVTSAGFTLATTLNRWSWLRRSIQTRTKALLRRHRWLLEWGLPRWRARLRFDVVATDMPVLAQPDGVAVVTQTLSGLEYLCHLRQQRLSDVEAVWVETVEGKRFEQPLARDARRTLRALGSN